MGRVDYVINVAGHRLSTGEMEEVVATHKDVAECSVIGDRAKEEVRKELAQMVRNLIGPIACYKETSVVKRLPKTRSVRSFGRRCGRSRTANSTPSLRPSMTPRPSARSRMCLKRSGMRTKNKQSKMQCYSRSAVIF